jgi:hypothetical protein
MMLLPEPFGNSTECAPRWVGKYTTYTRSGISIRVCGCCVDDDDDDDDQDVGMPFIESTEVVDGGGGGGDANRLFRKEFCRIRFFNSSIMTDDDSSLSSIFCLMMLLISCPSINVVLRRRCFVVEEGC